MLLDKKISGGQRPSKWESSVFRHRVLILRLSRILTLTLPTLPPQERYKGRHSLDVDLLRWAENRLLQSVFTLHRMK